MMQKHGVRPTFSWGSLDKVGQRRWKRLACEDEFARAAAQAMLPDEGAVLKTADFPGASALAATLRRLAAGPEPEHFRWRAREDRAPAFQRVLDMSAHKYTALCRVCERLQADKARS